MQKCEMSGALSRMRRASAPKARSRQPRTSSRSANSWMASIFSEVASALSSTCAPLAMSAISRSWPCAPAWLSTSAVNTASLKSSGSRPLSLSGGVVFSPSRGAKDSPPFGPTRRFTERCSPPRSRPSPELEWEEFFDGEGRRRFFELDMWVHTQKMHLCFII